jgi:DNA replication and repair protein RecF
MGWGKRWRTVIARIRLENFRNYASLDLEIPPGLTVLHGPNAQGKTNLLEAVHLISTTRLLRGSRESDAIREGAAFARVEATLAETSTEIALTIEAGRRKIAQLNRQSLPRAADVIGRLPSLCVSQADMAIVRGEPSDRRLFLDLELSQLYPAYLNDLAHYKRALEQRNALLRRAQEHGVSAAEFEPWEAAMAGHGSALRAQRRAYIEAVAEPAREVHAQFGGGERFRIAYETKDDAVEAPALRAALAEGRPREIARGSSLFGPHRDDLVLFVENRDARGFGSQGQQRTAVLAVKLAAHEFQSQTRGVPPLLLLDDMLSDLDETRRGQLVEWVLRRAGQALLTCTEPSAAGPALVERAQLFEIRNGTALPEATR